MAGVVAERLWSIASSGRRDTGILLSAIYFLSIHVYLARNGARQPWRQGVAVMMHNSADLIASLDVRQLDTVGLGVLRLMFPAFAAEMELGRYVRRVLSSGRYATVYFEPHRDVDGRLSQHVFDVYGSATWAGQSGRLQVEA